MLNISKDDLNQYEHGLVLMTQKKWLEAKAIFELVKQRTQSVYMASLCKDEILHLEYVLINKPDPEDS